MISIIKTFLSSSLVKARLLKLLNGASVAAGAWALTSTYTYVTTHFSFIEQADALSLAGIVSATVAGLILTGGSVIFSQLDVTNVHDKIVTAAVTGSVEAPNDKEVVKAVKDVVVSVSAPTGSQASVEQAIALLKEGKE